MVQASSKGNAMPHHAADHTPHEGRVVRGWPVLAS
ncbi:hypothetical protein QO011_005095 [Labrys wisconsinensis]|uniref:Uncharacterized protein n=1 Tax=Labrys wisconsinensis TaxID=425677 RepID=A0ABU0JEY9_9HYPH|nr:hypothetical protein [Labrys wisconsinensis]